MAASQRPYVTVTSGMRGHYAVLMWFNDEDDHGNKIEGFWEPLQTGDGSYRTTEGAEREARDWAQAEGLEFRRG